MARPETAAVRRDGGVTGTWSPLFAYVLSALYIWILFWLIVWVAVPALVLRWEPVLITSDSMAPKVRSGDFVLLAEASANLDPGSVVTFTLNDHLVTHRVAVANGDGTYITQGDANPLPDSTLLSDENIEGAPRLLVSTVGMPLLWYQRGDWVPFSIWVLVTIGAASYLVSETDRRRRRPEGDPGRDDLHERSRLGRVAAAALVAFVLVGATVPSAAAFSTTTGNSPDTFTASEWELFVGLVGGVGHSCGVNDEGVVWCWGLNDKGQLGDGSTTDHGVPVRVGGLSGVVELGAGEKHSCGVTVAGAVWCWGLNNEGQLGDNSTSDSWSPVQVSGLTGAVGVSGGVEHSCAVKSDGAVWCWGRNDKGQLGDNSTTDSLVPVQVSGLTGAVAVGVGSKHSCAVTSAGAVWCWGLNNEGQLGDNSTTDSWVPVAVGGVSGAVDVSGGVEHSCAVTGGGAAWCWGRNDKGQLGDGSTTDSLTAVQVVGVGGTGVLGSVVEIDSGVKHNCVRLSDDTVRCWGLNDKGQLGNNTTTDSSSPVQVVGVGGVGVLTGIVTVGTGDFHSCGAHQTHTVYCWGLNNQGQLGDDTTTDSPTPTTTISLGRADAEFVGLVGGVGHSCGVNDEGVVWCWGLNDKGQLGDGSTTDHGVPVRVGGLSGVVELGAGEKHSCGVTVAGAVWCWGLNNEGQLGDNSTSDSWSPVQVSGLTGAVGVSGGVEHSCAVKSDGAVWCWGRNDKGQLGDNSTTDSLVPVQVSGLTGAVAVGVGSKHSCAVTSAGAVWCWGLNNEGQLGDNSTTDSWVPVAVGGVSGAVDVSGGVEHSCAVTGGGAAWCWGRNDKGQLGDGSTTDSLTAVQVVGVGGTGVLGSVVEIDSGVKHNCVRLSDDTVRCWGLNDKGQLGNTTTTDSSSPVQVVGVGGVGVLTGIVTVGTGDFHSCGAHQTHTVYCWGLNNQGQLGDDTTTDSPTPTPAIGT